MENKKGREAPFFSINGGEGGIRTHVPELPDHPISSRRRYDHFGTSPLTQLFARYLSFHGINLSNFYSCDGMRHPARNAFVKAPNYPITGYSNASGWGLLHGTRLADDYAQNQHTRKLAALD